MGWVAFALSSSMFGSRVSQDAEPRLFRGFYAGYQGITCARSEH